MTSLGEAVIEVGADADGFTRDVNGRLRDARGRFVKAGDDAGKGFSLGLRKGLGGGVKSFGQLEFSLAKVAAGASGLLSSIVPLPAALGGVAAGVVAIGGAAAQASASALSAGGALASLGLAAATLQVGTIGLSDAFEAQSEALTELARTGAVTAETQEALDEAMQGLAPSARGVVRAVGDIGPAWQKVQQAVQQDLFEGLGNTLREVSDAVLPAVRTGLTQTAGTLNAAAQSFGDFITAGGGAELLDGILVGLNETLEALLPGIGDIGVGLLEIFDGALGPSQDLAEAFSNAAESFREWAESVNASGALTEFLEGANDIAGDLLGILGNLGSILGSVFGAGAEQGATLLSIFEEATGKLADFLNTVEGQDALQSFFDLIKITGDTIGELGAVVGPIFEGIGDVLEALLPHVSALRDALLPVATVLGETIGGLLTVLAPVLGVLAGVIVGVVEAIAPLVTTLLETLVPAVGEIVGVFMEELVPAFGELLPAIQPFVTFFIASLIPTIKGAIQIATGIIKGLVKVISGVVNVIAGIMTGDWSRVWKGVKQIVEGNIDVMIGIVRGLWTVIKGRVNAIAGILPGIGESFGDAWRDAKRWIDNLIQGVRNIPGNFRRGLQAIGSALRSRIIDPFFNVNARVRNAIGNLIDRVKAIPRRITNALGNIGRLLYNAGRNVIGGLIDGIWSQIGAIANAMYGVTSTIRSYLPFSPAKVGPLSGSGNPEASGETIARMLSEGIARGTRQASAAMSSGLQPLTAQPLARQAASNTTASPSQVSTNSQVTVNQNYFGPSSSGGRLRDIESAVRFGTLAESVRTPGRGVFAR